MPGKLVIGPEGFVDLRRNPPSTTVTVQGGIELPEPAQPVETVPEPPAPPREETLPAVQKTTDGLMLSVAESVKVSKWGGRQPAKLMRIDSSSGPPCYAIVSKRQFDRLGRYQWIGTRSGHLYRKIKNPIGGPDTIVWLHREAAQCYRNDRFVAFLNGDERLCIRSNIRIVGSREEVKAIRRQALSVVSGSSVQKTQPQ